MKRVSKEYLMVLNLINTAKEHKDQCNSNCNVSLGMLKETAKRIIILMTNENEIIEASELLTDEKMNYIWY